MSGAGAAAAATGPSPHLEECKVDPELDAMIDTMATRQHEYKFVSITRPGLPEPFRMAYRLSGVPEGHRTVFIMGFAATSSAWDCQEEYLLQRGDPPLHMVFFDNAGVGLSDIPPGRYTTSMMAEDTRQMLDQIGWLDDPERPVHLVGTSMGGMIAQELALILLQAKRLGSLTLLSTHTGGWASVPPMHVIAGFLRGIRMTDPRRLIREVTIPPLYTDEYLDSPWIGQRTKREYVENWILKRRLLETRQPLRSVLSQFAAVMSHRVPDSRLRDLKESGVPILAASGTADRMIDSTNTVKLAQVLEARMRLFPGVGHAINVEATAEVATEICDIITRGRKWFAALRSKAALADFEAAVPSDPPPDM